ncbi:universal stress protein [Mycolicibacter hiberniae]|uniref:Universal stress protein n=1 Tax=Mycolicibacter hiberniae TaxID=29314 RepID=A0A7I7X6C2_9MYCO|nr:universal stress protein [Mycolicibacter hiberniae]MCV7086088.1 universal stress protein [Mycolicibacter hiberniae]ORV70646.1 universal stress protein [Mycolicibacter hiberniae]BBZ24201.1 universal stress protein [Mycolicibacter hiberniae]
MSSTSGILVGVDGSPSSATAVDWAARDAALHNLPLTLVHVLASPVVMTFPETPMPSGYTEWQREQGERHLREAAEIAAAAGATHVSAEIVVGSTVPMLVDMSREAARLVVGSRGYGRMRRLLLGSVSSSLVRHADCAVAVIHEDHQRSDTAPVVVGIDGSPVSEAATALAFEEASLRGVELIAVYAWHDTGLMDFPGLDTAVLASESELALAERLAGWRERYPDVTVRRVVVDDRPADQLIDQSRAAQLVVVGSHGRGGFTGMLLGSVSQEVVQSAHAPVIVVRPA